MTDEHRTGAARELPPAEDPIEAAQTVDNVLRGSEGQRQILTFGKVRSDGDGSLDDH